MPNAHDFEDLWEEYGSGTLFSTLLKGFRSEVRAFLKEEISDRDLLKEKIQVEGERRASAQLLSLRQVLDEMIGATR